MIEEKEEQPLQSAIRTRISKKKIKKNVSFQDDPVLKVHYLIVWSFASKQARKGTWHLCEVDRTRFQKRVRDIELIISFVFSVDHRWQVFQTRFQVENLFSASGSEQENPDKINASPERRPKNTKKKEKKRRRTNC